MKNISGRVIDNIMALNNAKNKIDSFGSPVFASELDMNMIQHPRSKTHDLDTISVGRGDLV